MLSENFVSFAVKKYQNYFVFLNILFIFIMKVNCRTNILNKMNKFQKQTLKVRILKLADLKSTGSPADLASRFEISERSIKRFVKEIRDEGTEIRYCQIRGSYVTEKYFT